MRECRYTSEIQVKLPLTMNDSTAAAAAMRSSPARLTYSPAIRRPGVGMAWPVD